jgi:hypothetical protein
MDFYSSDYSPPPNNPRRYEHELGEDQGQVITSRLAGSVSPWYTAADAPAYFPLSSVITTQCSYRSAISLPRQSRIDLNFKMTNCRRAPGFLPLSFPPLADRGCVGAATRSSPSSSTSHSQSLLSLTPRTHTHTHITKEEQTDFAMVLFLDTTGVTFSSLSLLLNKQITMLYIGSTRSCPNNQLILVRCHSPTNPCTKSMTTSCSWNLSTTKTKKLSLDRHACMALTTLHASA